MDIREKFVRDLYLGVLKRTGEDSGVYDAVAALGETPSFQEAADILNAFLNSSEAREARLWHRERAAQQDPVKSVASIGTHCLTSFTLKKIGLKKKSGPFDWVFSSIPMVTHCIEDDFTTFLDKRHFQPVPANARSSEDVNLCDHAFYRDRFGVAHVFNHYDISVGHVYDYYVRCVDRFRTALRSNHRNLLIGVAPETVVDDEFSKLCDALKPFHSSELVLTRAKKSDVTKFGAELVAEIGRHKLFDLYFTGTLEPLSFGESADEAMFRRIIDAYSFEL